MHICLLLLPCQSNKTTTHLSASYILKDMKVVWEITFLNSLLYRLGLIFHLLYMSCAVHKKPHSACLQFAVLPTILKSTCPHATSKVLKELLLLYN